MLVPAHPHRIARRVCERVNYLPTQNLRSDGRGQPSPNTKTKKRGQHNVSRQAPWGMMQLPVDAFIDCADVMQL